MSSLASPARIAFLLLVPATLGCSLGTAPSPFTTGPEPGTEASTVSVNNPHWADLTIYLERDGTLHRLGTVQGMTSATFRVPTAFVPANAYVRLVACRNGRESFRSSERFPMTTGTSATWRISITSGDSPVSLRSP